VSTKPFRGNEDITQPRVPTIGSRGSPLPSVPEAGTPVRVPLREHSPPGDARPTLRMPALRVPNVTETAAPGRRDPRRD
jgi:hypothetical protein